MRRVLHMFAVFAFFIGFGLAPRPVTACGICVELPEYSLADRILSARVLVLAAPSPDDPFRYTPVAVLKGTADEVENLPDIPFLVDSVTRSALRADPDRTTLMVYGAGKQDKAGRSLPGGWTKGFLMTPDRAHFLTTLRVEGERWATATSNSSGRIAFFSQYLTHDDRVMRNTALLEIHRAPYWRVAHLTDAVPTALLVQELRNPNRLAYAPALIRLMGLQSDPSAREYVRLRYQNAVRSGDANLFDWALAGIEGSGDEAVTEIERSLKRPELSAAQKRNLIQSLTDGGTAHPQLRPRILSVFERQLSRDNSFAILIAMAAKRWDSSALTPAFQAAVNQGTLDPATFWLIQEIFEGDPPD